MTDPAAARLGVMELHARYADAVWRKDADTFAQCFTPDGEWRISGMVLKGRAEISETIGRIMDRMDRVLMSFKPPILQVGEGRASGRTYVDERVAWADGTRNISIGRYYEHFVQADGRWLFEWRLFQLLYRGPADLSGEYFDHDDYGPPPGMPPRDALTGDMASVRWGLREA